MKRPRKELDSSVEATLAHEFADVRDLAFPWRYAQIDGRSGMVGAIASGTDAVGLPDAL